MTTQDERLADFIAEFDRDEDELLSHNDHLRFEGYLAGRRHAEKHEVELAAHPAGYFAFDEENNIWEELTGPDAPGAVALYQTHQPMPSGALTRCRKCGNQTSIKLSYATVVEPVTDDVLRDALIKTAVDRFLGWKLPKTFAPDCGISFNKSSPPRVFESTWWPIGTNLFTADEAKKMFEYCLSAAIAKEKAE